MIPYFVLILVFSLLSEARCRGRHPFRIIAVFLLILFIGLRNEIGTDYDTYREFFYNSSRFDIGMTHFDPGWHLLNEIISEHTAEFKVMTLVHAALLVMLLHFSLKDFKYYTFAFILFILLLQGYSFIVNVMRQGLSMAVFFYSWRFIKSREALKYWTCILLAATIHFSVLFVAPAYWLAQRSYSYKFYLIVQFISFFLFVTHLMDSLLTWLIGQSSYANYLVYNGGEYIESTINSGMKYLTLRMGSLFVLLYYRKLLDEYPQHLVPFNMFFYSVVLGDMFANIRILGRMLHYFDWAAFIVIPLFLSTVFKKGPSYRMAQSFVLAAALFFFVYNAYTDVLNNLFYTF